MATVVEMVNKMSQSLEQKKRRGKGHSKKQRLCAKMRRKVDNLVTTHGVMLR
jgi:hypothetical protein